jgi:hypothetical protein
VGLCWLGFVLRYFFIKVLDTVKQTRTITKRGGVMNLFLLFMSGLIFLTCFYGQTQLFSVNWFLIFGMVFSTAVSTWIMGEGI